MQTILLTGGAGFIGSHLTEALLAGGGYNIICLDSFDDFYPVAIKQQNIRRFAGHPRFSLLTMDIAFSTVQELRAALQGKPVDIIIHLAAKAGVRPSIEHPLAYYQTNVLGTLNLLELARQTGVQRFIFASSSSVYGNNAHMPWKETEQGLRPISPYASSKIAAEELGQVYAHLHNITFTALRFFTVYGPAQRPDLAIHKFYNQIRHNEEITLYGDGSTSRDYTYVSDIVQGVLKSLAWKEAPPFSAINIGSGRPVTLLELVHTLEEAMHVTARIRFMDEQPGDVKHTYADISAAQCLLHYAPSVSLREGVASFLRWKESPGAFDY